MTEPLPQSDDAVPPDRLSALDAAFGRRTVRWLDWLVLPVWGLVVLVGILQTKRIDAGWLTAYGADVVSPIALWWGLRRTVFARIRAGAELAASTILLGSFAWEWSQRFDLSGTVLDYAKGTFDPFDLLAYLVTMAACYALDKYLQRRQEARAV